ncbi:hypothetical protein QRD02_03855 [Aequorivita sp. SDUM287046]|uniref:Lamin tail domain-containing protein n=1 Tax=Aequorivita aurantiaca TaxID=3053356 RepID=A0ABT8DE10_9FLAO|nr:hypothetical protein [Aequorivita aurantiaca]MDN3723506.1 hypothetical protein [Aequorivita aurantiaca]
MRTIILFFASAFFATNFYCQVGIGTTTPSPASMLEVSSTSDGGTTYKGFMPPRVPSIAAREAINPGYADFGLMVFVMDLPNNLGLLQIWDGDSWEEIHRVTLASPIAWINEFHYDNAGTDQDEFIEIAGPAGLDLSTYSIELYNGVNRQVYNTTSLSGTIPDQSNGIGTISFSYPSNGIENGAPDGLALIDSGTVLYFISYEGSFTASNGTAIGLTSTDIGVSEPGSTPIGESLQLTGTGHQYTDFLWSGPSVNTAGAINSGQTFN